MGANMGRGAHTVPLSGPNQWVAALACGWALLFAALSFFWAAGGHTGLQPLEQAPEASRGLWAATNIVAGLLKVGGGLLALALVYLGGRPRLHRALLIAAWIGGIGFCLYGGLGLISDILHVTGIIDDPATRHWFMVYLVLWDPYWMLGGILYVAIAWLTVRADAKAALARAPLTEQA